MLATHLHHIRTEDHFVLVVFLVLVEGVIEVDIFDIRRQRRSRSVTLRLLLRRRGVTLRTVEMLVTVQDRHLFLVVVRTPVVMEIIARRVIPRRETVATPRAPNIRRDLAFQLRQVLTVDRPTQLLFGAQTVQTDVLHSSRAFFVTEGYDGTRRPRYKTPDSTIHTSLVRRRNRQTVLESLLAVTQNILADVTEVDI